MESRKTFREWKPESYAHRTLTPAEILPEDDLGACPSIRREKLQVIQDKGLAEFEPS